MRGFSLPVVLFALSLGSALAVGGAFVTRQLAAGSRMLTRSASVDALASEWIARTATGFDAINEEPQLGTSRQLPSIDLPDATVRRWMARTDSSFCWLVVEVVSKHKPLQRRRLGVLMVLGDSVWSVASKRGFVDLP